MRCVHRRSRVFCAPRGAFFRHPRAGQGELVDAVILFADLRDFTAHTAQLDPVGTVRLLNDYFDCLVGPIEEYRGHVLKFIGDAVLAFFPLLPEGPEPEPLEAVQTLRKRLAQLNRGPSRIRRTANPARIMSPF